MPSERLSRQRIALLGALVLLGVAVVSVGYALSGGGSAPELLGASVDVNVSNPMASLDAPGGGSANRTTPTPGVSPLPVVS